MTEINNFPFLSPLLTGELRSIGSFTCFIKNRTLQEKTFVFRLWKAPGWVIDTGIHDAYRGVPWKIIEKIILVPF
jgi:hypothetical protein